MTVTQTVSMWLANDYEMYHEAITLGAASYQSSIDRDEAFKDWVWSMKPDDGGMFGDMISHALAEVDWSDIADDYTPDDDDEDSDDDDEDSDEVEA